MGAVLGAPEPVGYLRVERKIDTRSYRGCARANSTRSAGIRQSLSAKRPAHPLDGKRLSCIIAVMTDVITAAPTAAISHTYIRAGRKVCPAKTLGSPAGISMRHRLDEDVLEGLHISLAARGWNTALDVMAEGVSGRAGRPARPRSRRSFRSSQALNA